MEQEGLGFSPEKELPGAEAGWAPLRTFLANSGVLHTVNTLKFGLKYFLFPL